MLERQVPGPARPVTKIFPGADRGAFGGGFVREGRGAPEREAPGPPGALLID